MALRLAALRHQGWQTTVYTPDSPALDAPFRNAAIDLRHLPMRSYSDFHSIRVLARHLSGEQQDTVILAQNSITAFISLCARKLAGRPDIRVVLISSTNKPPRTGFLARRMYRNLSAVAFTSIYSLAMHRMAEQQTGRILIPPHRIHVLYTGVGEPPEQTHEPPKGPFIALYNGELRPGCGLRHLIDNLDQLRHKRIRLMIAGQGKSDYMDRLRRHAIRRDVMDLISWRRERPTLSELTATAHFGIFPYRHESLFSDANIELMAAGMPQILPPGKLAHEYLSTDGGALYTPTSPFSSDAPSDPLIAAMLRLAASPALCATLGQSAAARYRRHFLPDPVLTARPARLQ